MDERFSCGKERFRFGRFLLCFGFWNILESESAMFGDVAGFLNVSVRRLGFGIGDVGGVLRNVIFGGIVR